MKTEWKKLLNNEDFSRSESAVALSRYTEFGIAFWPVTLRIYLSILEELSDRKCVINFASYSDFDETIFN